MKHKITFALTSLIVISFLGITSISLALENTWTTKADMLIPEGGAASCAIDNMIYVTGGGTSFTATPAATMLEYDVANDKWTKKTDMNDPRFFHVACAVNGKVYVMGGANSRSGNWQAIPSVEEYDPTKDKWIKKSDMPTPRAYLSACVINNKIYTLCGMKDGFSDQPYVEIYDPAKDTWTRGQDSPIRRTSFAAEVANGKIYVFGGINPGYVSAVQEYDPTTDTWTQKADIPTLRDYLSCSTVDDKIYVMGGEENGTSMPIVEMYDPKTNTWTKKASMANSRLALTTSAVDGKIYAFGGMSIVFPTKLVAPVEVYDTGFIQDKSSAVSASGKLSTTWGKIKQN
jgi:N-acetylneuraminic acid mutarotase